jgi:hypothetical protein
MSTLEDIVNVRKIDADDAIKCCYANGWAANGLPVVPPECARVDLFIALLITMSPSAKTCHSRKRKRRPEGRRCSSDFGQRTKPLSER